MGFIIGAIAFVGGIWITLGYVDKVRAELQGQINYLIKENSKLKLEVIELNGKTNGHDIKMNGLELKTNLNEIELKYMKKGDK